MAEEKTENTKIVIITTATNSHGRKPYPFANGREKKNFTLALYGDNAEYCEKKGKKMGFTSGAISHYINYLIDRDRGYIKEIREKKKNGK